MNTPREFKVKLSSDSDFQSINLPVNILKEVAEATGASMEGVGEQITLILKSYLKTGNPEATPLTSKSRVSYTEATSSFREFVEGLGITGEEFIEECEKTRDRLYKTGELK